MSVCVRATVCVEIVSCKCGTFRQKLKCLTERASFRQCVFFFSSGKANPPLHFCHYELAVCVSTAFLDAHFPNCMSLSPDRAGSGLSTHSHTGRRVDGASLCFLHSDARLAPWRQHSLP
eukprot:7375994-Prymnesium_polylepis.2